MIDLNKVEFANYDMSFLQDYFYSFTILLSSVLIINVNFILILDSSLDYLFYIIHQEANYSLENWLLIMVTTSWIFYCNFFLYTKVNTNGGHSMCVLKYAVLMVSLSITSRWLSISSSKHAISIKTSSTFDHAKGIFYLKLDREENLFPTRKVALFKKRNCKNLLHIFMTYKVLWNLRLIDRLPDFFKVENN